MLAGMAIAHQFLARAHRFCSAIFTDSRTKSGGDWLRILTPLPAVFVTSVR
jgi:hypothetical protein